MGRKNKKRAAKKRAAEQSQQAAEQSQQAASVAPPTGAIPPQAADDSVVSRFRGKLFDTQLSPVDCFHGSLSPTSPRRQEAASMIAKYFDFFYSPDVARISQDSINFRFLGDNRESVGPDMAALVLNDAANLALTHRFTFARQLVHLHVLLDTWLQADKPWPIGFRGNDEQEGQMSPIWQEIKLVRNTIETPREICHYIHKHVPCDCLRETLKSSKKEVSRTQCDGCNKEGTHGEFKACSGCKGAWYCSQEVCALCRHCFFSTCHSSIPTSVSSCTH